LVVFSSDHGEMLGNHQQLLKGPQLYDDLARVPLIARWPDKFPAGVELSHLVQWIDLPATFLQAANCSTGTGVQGESWIPLATGTNNQWRKWAVCEYRYSGFSTDPLIMTTMLRCEEWKLIIWHGQPACGNTRDGELYNLKEDPGELRNLFHSPKHLKQRRQMKKLLLDVQAKTEDQTEPQVRYW